MLSAIRRTLGSPAQTGLRAGASRYFQTEIPVQAISQFPTQVTTLPNGVRVATQKTWDETATVGLWIDAGTRYETPESNGTAHFLEHMFFKGTTRRPRLKLEQEIENLGAHLNAYTTRENTVFYGKVYKDDVNQMMDVLADITQNSTITEEAMEEERGVILRERWRRLRRTIKRLFSTVFTKPLSVTATSE